MGYRKPNFIDEYGNISSAAVVTENAVIQACQFELLDRALVQWRIQRGGGGGGHPLPHW